MRSVLTLITVISLVAVACGANRQPASPWDARPEVLDAFIKELAARSQFNGNILVAERGEIIYERAIGLRSPLPGDTLNLGTQFRLASASQPFTALAVMQLEEVGLLDYEDPVEKYIPEWPYKGATIRNLLNETSGFPGVRALFDRHWKPDLQDNDPGRITGGNKHMIQMFIEHLPEPYSDPGEAYRHIGTDYKLLVSVVERVSGVPYHQYLREKVFLRAGMMDTYAISPLREDPLTNRAYGMRELVDGSGLTKRDFNYLDSIEGHAIYSTVRDLHRWDRALYTDRLVSEASLEEAFAPGVLNNGKKTTIGFAWSLGDGSVSVDGYAVGFGVWLYRDLEEQNTIIILTNRNLYLWAGVIQGVRRILRGEDYELPKFDGMLFVGRTLLGEGEKAARDLYVDLKNRPGEYDLGGLTGLQALGYFLLQDGHPSEALFVFRLNSEQYPGAVLVWNMLGDAYHSLGDTNNAVASYHKALTIEPSSAHALDILQLLESRSIPPKGD